MYDMNDRIDGLEKDVSVLKADLAQLNTKVEVILSNYATKADVAKLEATMLKLFLGGLIAMAGMFVAAAKYIH
jgi:hypothetical protein